MFDTFLGHAGRQLWDFSVVVLYCAMLCCYVLCYAVLLVLIETETEMAIETEIMMGMEMSVLLLNDTSASCGDCLDEPKLSKVGK